MISPLCPVCGTPLIMQNPTWRCENGHGFDVARQGYVNLLTVDRKHSLHPGDSQVMVAARREFLNAGHYAPIARTLCALVEQWVPEARSILDAGCGEGYYLSQLRAPERWGIDISKQAVRAAASRDKSAHWLTATAAHLPFADGSFDCVLSMFALTAAEEFLRVLKPGGIFIQVLAGENHLAGLKSIIYPTVLHREKTLHPQLPGFRLMHSQTLRFSFTLEDAAMVQRLLYMTPHAWRISRAGAQALEQVSGLCDEAEVIFNVYAGNMPDNLL